MALSVWILVFFSILGVAIYRIVSAQLMLSRALEDRICSYRLARAAYIDACARNKIDITPYDTLAELRQKQEREFGRVKFIYSLIDEESKININTSSAAILKRLPGLDEELAQKLWTSDLKPFVRKEEVLLVEGMSEELFNQFKDLITVHSNGKINLNTAQPNVLKVLGLDEDLINIIVTFRKGHDGEEATDDDEIFDEVDGILNRLRSFTGLSLAQELSLLQVKDLLDTAASNFSLEVQTYIANRPAMKYSIIIDGSSIKQWTEW